MALRGLLALSAALVAIPAPVRAEPACWVGKTTGYLRWAGGGHTADGTPVSAPIAMAAVDWRSPIRFGTVIAVEGAGVYQVRDTGYLAAAGVDLDLMVDSLDEARAMTGWREMCVVWEPE